MTGLASPCDINAKQASLLCFLSCARILVKRYSDGLQVGNVGRERVLTVLAAQANQSPCQVLRNFGLVLALSRQLCGLLEPLGVPIRKLLLDDAPQPRGLQSRVDRLRWTADALQSRALGLL